MKHTELLEVAKTLVSLSEDEAALLTGIVDLMADKKTFHGTVRRKGGRPKGSKNKPKVQVVAPSTNEGNIN